MEFTVIPREGPVCPNLAIPPGLLGPLFERLAPIGTSEREPTGQAPRLSSTFERTTRASAAAAADSAAAPAAAAARPGRRGPGMLSIATAGSAQVAPPRSVVPAKPVRQRDRQQVL